MLRPTRVCLPLLVGASVLLVAGCGGPGHEEALAPAEDAVTVTVALTDHGCAPQPAKVVAGPVDFQVANDGATAVTEAELLNGSRVLGEKENLTPGLSGTFSLTLSPGNYTVYCPGAEQERSRLIVTGAAGMGVTAVGPRLTGAVRHYRHFVVAQTEHLARASTAFARTLKHGDVHQAKAMYPHVRSFYERIEPVAESFGSLDPGIDARVNDVAAGDSWTGFHRIEKILWQQDTTRGTTSYADKLVADVTRLRHLVGTVPLQAAQIANGGVELLGEIANSKITGEEERYSHTDLYDFEANLDGVKAVVAALRPAVSRLKPQLIRTIDVQLTTVEDSLRRLRTGGRFVRYTEANVPDSTRRELTAKVDALAESLSQVAPVVAR